MRDCIDRQTEGRTDRQTEKNRRHRLKPHTHYIKVKGKGRTFDVAPQVGMATTKALRYIARTKQRRTYLPYTSPAVAGTHLPTQRGWRVEY